jgi:glycosyltransferase involved in cell wall biosynthesis
VLRRLIRERQLDVLHGYEWPPALDAHIACRGTQAVSVCTVMSMSVAPYIPHRMPLVVGTAEIGAHETRAGRGHVTVIEPPVDLSLNRPDLACDVDGFRKAHGVHAQGPLVVCVGRLANELKLEGLLTAIDVLPRLHPTLELLVVGDGPARGEVARAAHEANRRAGRRVVALTGNVADPRPAYAAADVVLGMGGSALRAMAFAKPLIVQGEHGFWQELTSDVLDQFLWTGWYGVGSGTRTGAAGLEAAIRPLLEDAVLRAERGRFARSVVEQRFSLADAAKRQVAFYQDAARRKGSQGLATTDDVRAGALFMAHALERKLARRLGRHRVDDFNSRPIAGSDRHSPTGLRT